MKESSAVSVLAEKDLWFRRYHHGSVTSDLTLLCFPHAGGSATWFWPLSADLAGVAEVLAVQYPGRQDRYTEPPIGSIDGLVDRLLPLVEAMTDRRIVLFGHSMGACVAFELARRLGSTTRLLGLVVSGRPVPSKPHRGDVHRRDDAGVIAEMRRLAGTDPRLLGDDEVVRMIVPAVRADFQAVETYRYRPGSPLRCPVSVFTGTEDPQVTVAEARAWERLTDASFILRTFPGGHFYLAEQRAAVVAALVDDLTRFAVGNAALHH
ncbi:thioesterase [Micromonospora sp. C31]|uniref:thioesterase II family protein n=1 Tax=Micromonospora sp. C31 TaxID=2824876 RepID=UPI001B376760|nr:alpha/beta fold hydrolase [Micromonospora sp. C31]MBQ1074905.1 thioesterase [Micromonospora sp. C31]